MREAFTYMFKDNCFWKKAGILFVITLVSVLMLSYGNNPTPSGCPLSQAPQVAPVVNLQTMGINFIGWLIGLMSLGYNFIAIKAISSQEKNIVLPFFNFGTCFIKGLRVMISYFLLGLTLLLAVLFLILISKLNPVCYIISIFILAIAISFLLILFIAIMNYRANTDKILSIFAWKKAFILITENKKNYSLAILFSFLLGIVSMIILTIISIGMVFFIKTPLVNDITLYTISSLLGTYTAFVSMYLIAKAVKQGPPETPETPESV